MAQDKQPAGSSFQHQLGSLQEAVQQQQERRQQHFQDELNQFEPLDRLRRASWLMRHEQEPGPFGPLKPLSHRYLEKLQHDALQHVLETLATLVEPIDQVDYLQHTLLDLKLIPDHEDLVAGVVSQITLLRDHHSSDLARHLDTLRHQADAARAELQSLNHALADKERRATLTLATNWRHLARAAIILTRHPDLENQGAFLQVALDLQTVLGPNGRNPGITIWRGVHRLGKQLFQYDKTPESYLRFDGFQRLVFALIQDQ